MQGKDELPLFWAFLLHQLRSLWVLCDDSCQLITIGYAEYCGMVELGHFLPVSLAMMAVFSRLYVLCCRVSSLCSALYNHMVSTFTLTPATLTCDEVKDWEDWIGKLPASLDYDRPLRWQETLVNTSSNQRAIDELNRALQQSREGDDLGEEIAPNQLAASLVYRPTATPPPSMSIPTPSIRSESAPPTTSKHRTDVTKPSSESKHSEKVKVKEKQKHKEVRADKSPDVLSSPIRSDTGLSTPKKKDKPSNRADDDLFALVAKPKHGTDSSGPKHKEDTRKQKDMSYSKHRPGSVPTSSADTKKRKKADPEDAIDELFSLLPSSKKQKH